MRLQNYLITESGRSKAIDRDKAIGIITSKCKKSFMRWDKHGESLVRGQVYNMEGKQFGFVQPSKFNRTSLNTTNHYTLFIDNYKKWKKFPKRSESLICGNNEGAAYGSTASKFVILPYDNSKIGVCPASDLWASFRKTIDDDDLDDFNAGISDALDTVIGGTNYDSDWRTFDNAIDSYDDMIANLIEDDGDDLEYVRNSSYFIEHLIATDTTLRQFLEYSLDPQANGFKLIKAGDAIPQDKDRECWTDGDSVMISVARAGVLEFMDEVRSKL